MDKHVLEVGLLAPDAVDADAARDVPDQPQARACLHRLLLPGVAREHHLGPVALGELQYVMRLPRGQHPRLVHHDQGLGADFHLLLRREFEELVHAVGPGVTVVAELHRRAPRHRGRHDLVAVLLVKIGDGTEGGGLARSRRALDHRNASAIHGGVVDRQRLLLAQRITSSQEGLHLLLHCLLRQTVAGIGGHGFRHVPDRLFQPEVVTGGIDLGVDHARAGLGSRLLRLQPLDLRVAAQTLDGGLQRFGADQACRRIRRRFHHVRTAEHGLFPGQVSGKVVKPACQLPDGFGADLQVVSCNGGD